MQDGRRHFSFRIRVGLSRSLKKTVHNDIASAGWPCVEPTCNHYRQVEQSLYLVCQCRWNRWRATVKHIVARVGRGARRAPSRWAHPSPPRSLLPQPRHSPLSCFAACTGKACRQGKVFRVPVTSSLLSEKNFSLNGTNASLYSVRFTQVKLKLPGWIEPDYTCINKIRLLKSSWKFRHLKRLISN